MRTGTAGVVQAALDGLLDPQDRVGRELVAAPAVELLRGPDEPEHRLLDQVLHCQAVALVTAGELDHQAQVGVDEPLLGGQVALLDPLGELDLLLAREQGIAARLVQEELEAVGCLRRGSVIRAAPLRVVDERREQRVLAASSVIVVALGLSAS